MKKTIIILIGIVLLIIILTLSCQRKPDYVFSIDDPKTKLEIYILDGGATTSRYARFKIYVPESGFPKKIYEFQIEELLDVYSIQPNYYGDTLMVIFGGYSRYSDSFFGDTFWFNLYGNSCHLLKNKDE
jgi:hypothetical protein